MIKASKNIQNPDAQKSKFRTFSFLTLIALLYDIFFRSLPLQLYQISSKFRDEMRPKFGLIRSKEFLMKDLYTFDKDMVIDTSNIYVVNSKLAVVAEIVSPLQSCVLTKSLDRGFETA